jgi:sugar phosphate isomerase/epimerase
MKISTEIASCAKHVGEQKAIELFAKAGFDAWDFSMFAMASYEWSTRKTIVGDHPLNGPGYLAFARELKRIGLDNGIHCNQSHAPFPLCSPQIRSMMKRAIECTAEAGGKICIIHPDSELSVQENADMYWELLPFAKDHGVKIATENMWGWDTVLHQAKPVACSNVPAFQAQLELVEDDDFVVCLDIGHGEMKGLNTSAVELIHALGSKIQALHIHDNDRWHDSHQIPFSMDIDWEAVTKALADTGYSGYFTLEADMYLKAFHEENLLQGCKNLADSARKLAAMYAGYRGV